jgi:hypothetical protein
VLYQSILTFKKDGPSCVGETFPFSVRTILHKSHADIDASSGFVNREDDFMTENLGKCKFGGVPHLPRSLAFLGDRVDFVAQFDCSVLSEYDLRGLIPTEGFLWFGPREELEPSTRAEKEAKPVWFVTRFEPYSNEIPDDLLDFLGPVLFTKITTDGEMVLKKDPCVEACLTLFAIRKFRESQLSCLPRDIVKLIAQLLYKEAPSALDAWGHLRNEQRDIEELEPDLFSLMTFGTQSCCGFTGCDFFSSSVIPMHFAKSGMWRKFQGIYLE